MDFSSFIYGSYESASFTLDMERTVNMYVERSESPGSSSRAALYPTPGVTSISTAASGVGRAHSFINGREFAVIGSNFVEINSAGAQTVLGTVRYDSNPATISSNGDGGLDLFITSGDNGYWFDLTTNTFTAIAFLAGKARMGDSLDGFFLALDPISKNVYFSALLDGSTWSVDRFFARSSAPDSTVAMFVVGIYIWLQGTETSEVWYDAGSSPVPFAKHPSGNVTYGTAAPFSARVMGKEVAWLGSSSDGTVAALRASGFSPEVISSYPVQNAINGYATVADAVGDSYADRGHTFFDLTFPTEQVTWSFDLATRLWFEKRTWIAEEGRYTYNRTRWHAYAFGEHRTLGASNASLYRMSQDVALDVDSRPIRRLRRSPALMQENGLIFYPGFELHLDRGQGLVTGQGSNPQVMLRLSGDYGKTWSAEMWRSAGKVGEYGKRVRWDRCGSARGRVFEVVISDPIAWRIVGAFLDPDPTVAGKKAQQAA